MKKAVHSELFQIWKNVSEIVQPPVITNSAYNNPLLPTVDWSKVNRRFLNNIPIPVSLPKYGCSPEADDYEDKFERSDYGGMRNVVSKFTREFPFGSELGFLMDAGPVNVPDEVFHGYKFQPGQGWLLHATFLRLKEKENIGMKKRRKIQRGEERKKTAQPSKSLF